jgi:hypothetical protein
MIARAKATGYGFILGLACLSVGLLLGMIL